MNRVRDLTEHAAGASTPVTTVLTAAAGLPARALHDLAEGEAASLVVIGSSARGRVGRVLPGAVTDRLLHGAPCPVAVAPVGYSFEDASDAPRLIGVAFTDSPDGRAALSTACMLATRARGLVRLLTVAEPAHSPLTGALDPMALETPAERATPRRRLRSAAVLTPCLRVGPPAARSCPAIRRTPSRPPLWMSVCSSAALAATARSGRSCSGEHRTRWYERRRVQCSSFRAALQHATRAVASRPRPSRGGRRDVRPGPRHAASRAGRWPSCDSAARRTIRCPSPHSPRCGVRRRRWSRRSRRPREDRRSHGARRKLCHLGRMDGIGAPRPARRSEQLEVAALHSVGPLWAMT